MYIEAIETSGFSGLPKGSLALDRVARVDGTPRALLAFSDALQLAFAAYDANMLSALLARWGCREVTIEGVGAPEGAHWESAPGLNAVLDPAADGLLSVGLDIVLDPPQFGKLRKLAARDARLIDALADGALLRVRVGARFSPALDALALDPLGFVIGEETFPIAGADRPTWMTPFLQGLGGRLAVGPSPGAVWGERAASYRPEHQRAVRRALAALQTAPASLGDAVALPDGPAIFLGEELIPTRHLGADATYAAGVVAAVHLSGAEILVIDGPPKRWRGWLARQAEADGSALEQVILLGVPGGTRLG